MSSYPAGWSVLPRTVVRRERWPGGCVGSAVALVYPGQEIEPDQPIMRLRRAAPRPAAGRASADPFGDETAPAGLRGRVVDVTARGGVVIESRVAALQGALGAGGQVAGILTLWQDPGASQSRIPPGAILVVPGPVSFLMLRSALSSGVVGIIASSISLRDLEGFLRADLLDLLTSYNSEYVQSRLPPLTILLTEGLGNLPMPARILELLSSHQQRVALLSGSTSAREALFPELLISLPAEELQGDLEPVEPDAALVPGAHVRICCGEQAGQLGEIEYLFTHRQKLPSGVHARAARVRLADGSYVLAPIHGLERVA